MSGSKVLWCPRNHTWFLQFLKKNWEFKPKAQKMEVRPFWGWPVEQKQNDGHVFHWKDGSSPGSSLTEKFFCVPEPHVISSNAWCKIEILNQRHRKWRSGLVGVGRSSRSKRVVMCFTEKMIAHRIQVRQRSPLVSQNHIWHFRVPDAKSESKIQKMEIRPC